MGRAHNLLVQHDWHSAQLQEILAQTLSPFQNGEDGRISADGPPVSLPAKDALFLAIILHELPTNAIKYGALSRPEGHIVINWAPSEPDGKAYVNIIWREAGGPLVEVPKRGGFGTTLLRHMHSSEGGRTAIECDPAGVVCRMKVATTFS